MMEPQTNIPKASGSTQAPAVSIGMPVYNGAKYIRAALDSLLAQTFTDYELIISDNASTDDTQTICEEYAQRNSRIRYVRQIENAGALANFQFVLDQARGEYFMWAAHDDRWAPTFLNRTVAVLKKDESCGLVFSNYTERDLEGGTECHHKIKSSNSKSAGYNYLIRTFDMCPSLIYGLFRIDIVKTMRLENFDFSDVHFVSNVGVSSSIQVLEDYLYIAGVKGSRKPYSLTHNKINRIIFLDRQYMLLKEKFCFPAALFLFFILCCVMLRSKVLLWRY